MNLRELISSTPYTTVHAPRRGHIAYSTRKRAGTTVERTTHIDLCKHPSFNHLRTLARLATIPLPVYSPEGVRTIKKDDYALHYDDGHVLAVTITTLHSGNGTCTAETSRGLAYAAVTSYLESLNAARIPAALHHPTDGWSTNRSWMCSLYPHVLDELVHAAAQRRAALTTTTKGTDQ